MPRHSLTPLGDPCPLLREKEVKEEKFAIFKDFLLNLGEEKILMI